MLRILTAVLVDEQGNQRFRFLAPIYFISIVPVFYMGWFAMGFTLDEAREWGYLFPDPSCSDPTIECGSLSFHDKVFDGHVMDVFKIIDFRLINWTAVSKSFGTLVALCSFSLIHVSTLFYSFKERCEMANNDIASIGPDQHSCICCFIQCRCGHEQRACKLKVHEFVP